MTKKLTREELLEFLIYQLSLQDEPPRKRKIVVTKVRNSRSKSRNVLK